jgi:hypothetical protein
VEQVRQAWRVVQVVVVAQEQVAQVLQFLLLLPLRELAFQIIMQAVVAVQSEMARAAHRLVAQVVLVVVAQVAQMLPMLIQAPLTQVVVVEQVETQMLVLV